MSLSSLALLWNLQLCKLIDFKVMASCDGTDEVLSNNDQTLILGCISINRYGKKSFRPFLLAIGRAEREEIFDVLLVAFLKYARRIFGIINPKFQGGEVSDHSLAFVNGLITAFPEDKKHQCYPVSNII